MKKSIAAVLIFATILLYSISALALGQVYQVTPYASLSISGGLVYVTSEASYYIHGKCSGIVESKTVTITIYKQDGNDWDYVDSVSKTGTSSTVSTGKYVSLTSSGRYKVEVRGTTNNSDGTVPYYYNVTI